MPEPFKVKPTVEEFLAYAKEHGVEDDFMRTDLRTGERKPFERKLLQKWIDGAWGVPE